MRSRDGLLGVLLSALAAGVPLAVACGGPPEPASPSRSPSPAGSQARVDGDGARAGAGSASATVPAPPVAEVASTTASARPTEAPSRKRDLGPPKPTTIPLRAGVPGDDKLDQGDAEFEAGKLEQALRSYEAARVVMPKHPAPQVGVVRVRIAMLGLGLDHAAAKGRADVKALAGELRKAAQADKDYGPAHAELGRALLLLGEAPAAKEALARARELLPSVAEVHSAYGVACLATGAADEAVGALQRAVEIDPGSPARRGNLGTVLLMRGRVTDAIAEYQVRVELAGDDARAHSDLGTAMLADGNYQKAIPELERAIALEPTRATFHSNLGYALQLSGRTDRAIVQYREAVKLDPRLAAAWINLATALSRDPKTRAEARAALKRAEGLDPTDPRVKSNLEELDALEKGVDLRKPASSASAKPPPL